MKPVAISYKPRSIDGSFRQSTISSPTEHTAHAYRPHSAVSGQQSGSVISVGDPENILVRTLEIENRTLREQIASLLEREQLAKVESSSLREQLAETEKRSSSLTDELSSVISKELGDLKLRLQMAQADRDSVTSQFNALNEKLIGTEEDLTAARTGLDVLKTYSLSVLDDFVVAVRELCKDILPAYAPASISSGGLISLARQLEMPAPNIPQNIQACIHGIHGKVYELNVCLGDIKIVTNAFRDTANMVKDRLLKERDTARLHDNEHRNETERLREQLNTLRTDTDVTVRELNHLKPLMKSLETENSGLKAELSALSDKLRQSQGEVNVLLRKVEALEAENTSIQATISVKDDQISELQGAVTMFRMERDEATSRLTELEKNLIALTEDVIEDRSSSRGASMNAARPPPHVSQQSLRGHVEHSKFEPQAIKTTLSPTLSSPKADYENSRLIDMVTNGKLPEDRLSAALAQDRVQRRSSSYYD